MDRKLKKAAFYGLLVAAIPAEMLLITLLLPWLLAGGYAGPFIPVAIANILLLAYINHWRADRGGRLPK